MPVDDVIERFRDISKAYKKMTECEGTRIVQVNGLYEVRKGTTRDTPVSVNIYDTIEDAVMILKNYPGGFIVEVHNTLPRF